VAYRQICLPHPCWHCRPRECTRMAGGSIHTKVPHQLCHCWIQTPYSQLCPCAVVPDPLRKRLYPLGGAASAAPLQENCCLCASLAPSS
jgi:hypothetical protein